MRGIIFDPSTMLVDEVINSSNWKRRAGRSSESAEAFGPTRVRIESGRVQGRRFSRPGSGPQPEM